MVTEVEIRESKDVKEKDLDLFLNQFVKMLYVDFGLRVNRKIKEWYKLSWEEFRNELAENKVRLSECVMKDWEEFFHNHKRKVLSLMD